MEKEIAIFRKNSIIWNCLEESRGIFYNLQSLLKEEGYNNANPSELEPVFQFQSVVRLRIMDDGLFIF